MITDGSRAPERPRSLQRDDDETGLLTYGALALALSGWMVLASTMREHSGFVAYTCAFAGAIVLLLAPGVFLLSFWKLVRYRWTWRTPVAALLAVASEVVWCYATVRLLLGWIH
jgi:hypothetical protein